MDNEHVAWERYFVTPKLFKDTTIKASDWANAEFRMGDLTVSSNGSLLLYDMNTDFSINLMKIAENNSFNILFIDGEQVMSAKFECDEVTLHQHTYIEMAYVISGDYYVEIDGTDHVFHEGEVCLIDVNCAHREVFYHKTCLVMLVCIQQTFFSDMFLQGIEENSVKGFLRTAFIKKNKLSRCMKLSTKATESRNKIESYGLLILDEMRKKELGYMYFVKGALIRILDEVTLAYESTLSRQEKKILSKFIFEEVDRYLENHIENVCLADLTAEFNYQEDYFNRLIKQHTGKTYTEYLVQLRINKAAELLKGTDQSIDSIMNSVGYQNKGYFYKMFNGYYHMTPFAYRKMYGNSDRKCAKAQNSPM